MKKLQSTIKKKGNIRRRGIKKKKKNSIKKDRNGNDLFEFTDCCGIERDMCSKNSNSNISSCVVDLEMYTHYT